MTAIGAFQKAKWCCFEALKELDGGAPNLTWSKNERNYNWKQLSYHLIKKHINMHAHTHKHTHNRNSREGRRDMGGN